MKKYLFGLLTFILVGLINFGYCSDVSDLVINVDSFDGTIASHSFHTIFHATSSDDYGTYCIKINNLVSPNNALTLGFNSSLSIATNQDWSFYIYGAWAGNYVCMYLDMDYLYVYNRDQNSSVSFSYDLFKLNALLDTSLPRMTSLECQTEYNLIPVSSVDQNYCVNNGLCSSSECSGGVSSGNNWSALYINDIQHLSAPVINVSIPEEFSWDYTNDNDEFNLDIEGYNVDTEYIEGVINLQNTKPNQVDLNNIITGVIPLFVPGLVIILFIYVVFRFIKKVF